MAVDGAVSLPLVSVSGDSGAAGAVSLPIIQTSKNGVFVTLPLFSVSGAITNVSGAAVLPSLLATGEGQVGGVASAAITLPMFGARGQAGRDGYATITLPALETAGLGGVTSTYTAAIQLPMLLGLGALYNPPSANIPSTGVGDGYQVWVINPKTKAHTQYDNFLFSSFGEFNGKNYACGSDGIYQLTGDEDVDTAIDISLIWAASTLGSTRIKWVDAAYLHIRGEDGALEVWATVDERTRRIYTVDLDQSPYGAHTRRALFARGLFGTWWSVGVKKSCTSPFSLADIELRTINKQRRLR